MFYLICSCKIDLQYSFFRIFRTEQFFTICAVLVQVSTFKYFNFMMSLLLSFICRFVLHSCITAGVVPFISVDVFLKGSVTAFEVSLLPVVVISPWCAAKLLHHSPVTPTQRKRGRKWNEKRLRVWDYRHWSVIMRINKHSVEKSLYSH